MSDLVDGRFWNDFPELRQLKTKAMIFSMVCNMLEHEIEDISVRQIKGHDRIEKDGELVTYVPSGELELILKVKMKMPPIEELLEQYRQAFGD